ncbi:MAG TPA: 3-hydroxyacyl-CoA dehydrogenase/enoyl-CoA hydratase family protein [Polyangiaceae bacterium]|nr:3-hydroxyacyl-CoA dehydrogenase/enoyl-CoA hydratase family protein [Polyangiaceae bacterium]
MVAERIRVAGVIGAGVMGSAIAAHLAGAGIRTHLLDIVPPGLSEAERTQALARTRFAQAGLERALSAKPAAFFEPDGARLIQTGNLEDHLDRLSECDLVIEAVVENLELKRKLYGNIASKLSPRAILASNTSGLSIAQLSDALPAALRERFLILHFFNPVRYMRLLEIAPGPSTRSDVLASAVRFGEFLGKGIVYAKDTPNFVANRIGVYSMMLTLHEMQAQGLSVEAVDKITGVPMGRPKSAAFGTADLVGIDTLAHVAKNCLDSLVADEERQVFALPEFVRELIEAGRLGRKSGAGFYKKAGQDLLVYDPALRDYRAQAKVRFDSLGAIRNETDPGKRLKMLLGFDDPASRFAWKILSRSLAYSARRIPEIADDIVNIDRAMRWGFNWELGPFEAWDAIGVPESVSRMQSDGVPVPAWVEQMLSSGQTRFYGGSPAHPTYFDVAQHMPLPVAEDPRELRLAALKSEPSRVVQENAGASLVDLGDGVLGIEFHTKLNTLDGDVIELLTRAPQVAQERGFEAILIGSDGEHFCAGANLMLIAMAAQAKAWDQIENVVKALQGALMGLKYAPLPVVAAPFQYTLGGGCEVALAADARQAHAETYMGLVEVGVGLIPAGGGCLGMVQPYTAGLAALNADPLPFIAQASLNIATAKVSTSAEEAKALRYLSPEDGISLNRARLLHEAKARAWGLARAGYRPPLPRLISAAGYDAARTISARVWGMVEGGFASEHDALIANKVGYILCGGKVASGTLLTEQHYLDLEREAFLSLCGEEKTQLRIQHMLMNGKPLRN